MPRIKCPFCVKPLDPTAAGKCPSCGEGLPDHFVRGCREAPQLWMVTSGFSSHGKTTLLTAMILMLENMRLGNFYLEVLGQPTHEALQRMRVEALEGKTPDSTQPIKKPRPLLLRLHDAPGVTDAARGENHTLIALDVAGEMFATLDELHGVAALREVQTVWLMVSQPDLAQDRGGNTLSGLFQAYESAMIRLGASLEGRNVIVVFTKADRMNLPPEAESYLMADPFQDLTRIDQDSAEGYQEPEDFTLAGNLPAMERVSDLLAEYTRRRVPGGPQFINMVRGRRVNLRFCVTSATGGDPDQRNRLKEQARRFRVLDPLFWTLWLGQRREEKDFGLVLDASAQGGPVYADGLPAAVWDGLVERGEVTTYYLGHTRPVGLPGQRPPAASAPRARQRLIGPILERAGDDQRLLVLTTGPVLDLGDFLHTPWRDRLVLVTLGPDDESWPHSVPYRAGDDPETMLHALLQLTR